MLHLPHKDAFPIILTKKIFPANHFARNTLTKLYKIKLSPKNHKLSNKPL